MTQPLQGRHRKIRSLNEFLSKRVLVEEGCYWNLRGSSEVLLQPCVGMTDTEQEVIVLKVGVVEAERQTCQTDVGQEKK